MLQNQLVRKFQRLFLLILLLAKEIKDLQVVNQTQDQVLQLWFLIALQNKEQILPLQTHLVVLQTQDSILQVISLQIKDLILLVVFQIKDPVLHLVFLQIQELVPHLGHLLILKIQNQVPLLDHPITLQINQIIIKILIQKVQIRVLLKDNILVKMEKPKKKKL